ncbi:MAG: PorP/SprF family type IX secretion system membrane protein [Bacteroidota bacterium]
MSKTKFCLTTLLFIILFTLSKSLVFAQDIHFSQFNKSPLYVNPSYTGMFDGNWRFTNNYRNQWSSIGTAFETISAGFDKPFRLQRGSIAPGIYFVNDQSGAASLTTNKVFISLAYHRFINQHKISGGIQAGYVMNTFEMSSLTFPAQYNEYTGYFDSELPSQIDNYDENINFPDVNLGFAWSHSFEKITPVAGISVYHINTPSMSYLDNSDAKLPVRLAFNTYADIKLSDHWFARPDLFTSFTRKASNYLIGGVAGYNFAIESMLDKIYAGTEFRTQFHSTDAVVVMVGLGLIGFDVGISYDINISGLNQATNFKGAFEISLVYTNFVKELDRITIPCDRY